MSRGQPRGQRALGRGILRAAGAGLGRSVVVPDTVVTSRTPYAGNEELIGAMASLRTSGHAEAVSGIDRATADAAATWIATATSVRNAVTSDR